MSSLNIQNLLFKDLAQVSPIINELCTLKVYHAAKLCIFNTSISLYLTTYPNLFATYIFVDNRNSFIRYLVYIDSIMTKWFVTPNPNIQADADIMTWQTWHVLIHVLSP